MIYELLREWNCFKSFQTPTPNCQHINSNLLKLVVLPLAPPPLPSSTLMAPHNTDTVATSMPAQWMPSPCSLCPPTLAKCERHPLCTPTTSNVKCQGWRLLLFHPATSPTLTERGRHPLHLHPNNLERWMSRMAPPALPLCHVKQHWMWHCTHLHLVDSCHGGGRWHPTPATSTGIDTGDRSLWPYSSLPLVSMLMTQLCHTATATTSTWRMHPLYLHQPLPAVARQLI